MDKSFNTIDIYLLKLARITSLYKNYQNPNSDNWFDRIEEMPQADDLDGYYPAKLAKNSNSKFILVTHGSKVIKKNLNTDYLMFDYMGELCIKEQIPLAITEKSTKVRLSRLKQIEEESYKKDFSDSEIGF